MFSAAPDLVVWGPSTRPYVDYITFSANSCEVGEGCATPGRRRVLRFETETRNVGTADLVLGNPILNPRFVFDPCHGHYHFGEFARYQLLDQSGALVVEGKKIGFCLEDSVKWDPSAGPPPEVVAFSESPSSSAFEKVYTPRNKNPLLKRWLKSTCKA